MKKFLRRNGKTIFKGLLIAIVAIVVFEVLHDIATSQRGYEAIGGEIFVPLLIIFAKPLWEIIKAPFKAVKSEDAN